MDTRQRRPDGIAELRFDVALWGVLTNRNVPPDHPSRRWAERVIAGGDKYQGRSTLAWVFNKRFVCYRKRHLAVYCSRMKLKGETWDAFVAELYKQIIAPVECDPRRFRLRIKGRMQSELSKMFTKTPDDYSLGFRRVSKSKDRFAVLPDRSLSPQQERLIRGMAMKRAIIRAGLTPAEIRVVRLMQNGHSLPEISRALGRKSSTVRVLFSRARKKIQKKL